MRIGLSGYISHARDDHAGRSLQHKSAVVFVGACLSMGLGVVFQSYLAANIGTGSVADAFYLGTTVPTLMATAILGSSSSALIRFATEHTSLFGLRHPTSITRRLVLLSSVLSAVMVILGIGLLSGVIGLLSSRLRAPVGHFVLITAVVPPLAVLAGIGAVLALSRHRFVIATYGGAVNGLGLLGASLALRPLGLRAPELAVAVDVGYAVQLLFVSMAMRHSPLEGLPAGETRARALTAKHAITAVLLLIAASAIYKSQPLVERATGAFVGYGIPAALGYEEKISSALLQLAVFGFAVAVLPSLSALLARGDSRGATEHLGKALYATCLTSAAAIAFAVVSAGDLVRVLYERGAFHAQAAGVTRTLVLFALPGVAFSALAAPLVSVAYASGRVRQVAVTGLVGFVVASTATIALAVFIGYRGIVLGTGVGYVLTFLIFARRTGDVLPAWSWRLFRSRHGLRLLVAVPGIFAMAFAARAVVGSSQNLAGEIWRLGLVAAAVFAVALLTLHPPGRLQRRRGQGESNGARPRKSVLWITQGGRELASSRVRAFQVSDKLRDRGVDSRCVVGVGLVGRFRTIATMLAIRGPLIVVVQKLLFGHLMLALVRFRSTLLVWDCDDALHVGAPSDDRARLTKIRRRIDLTRRRVDIVTTSNPLLASELRPSSGRVIAVQGPAPDVARSHRHWSKVLIWLGSSSTARYLDLLGDAPKELSNSGWTCVAVGAPPEFGRFGWRCVVWSPSAQEEWLARALVGVMPQATDPWSDRKQGYKLLEYLAHGVVPVASDVLPARMVMADSPFERFLVRENREWARIIEAAAAESRTMQPLLEAVVDRHSVSAVTTSWSAAMGVAC